MLRRPLESALHACGDYVARLARHDIQASMSRIGIPYDNAKAERFMRTLEEEEDVGSACRAAMRSEGVMAWPSCGRQERGRARASTAVCARPCVGLRERDNTLNIFQDHRLMTSLPKTFWRLFS